jgi:hypothetical protein
MTRPKIGARSERKPTGRTVKLWVDSVSSATLPLLAGFSTTSVVVVADDAQNFRWSGWTVLFLAIAAVVLIAAVQCAYHARIALSEWCERVDEKERKKERKYCPLLLGIFGSRTPTINGGYFGPSGRGWRTTSVFLHCCWACA